MALSPGTRLGPYEIVSAIGAGGMGEVYRAHDTRLARDVAVKILPAAFADDVDRRTRFEREAQAIAALSHPNILAIFDVGTYAPSGEGAASAPIMCMVTELVDGESLRARMDAGRLPLSKAVDYARQVASGLAAAHAKGITHRDIKPENVFVTKDGHVKILDFGLTKQSTDTPGDATRLQSATAAGVVLGTVGYMSPEQVRGDAADARSDIFSFGVVLFELLAGERPFTGETAVQTMNAILTEDPPALTVTGRTLPPAFERVVRHCLEKNPEERFQSARDLAFALDALSSTSTSSSAMAAIEPVRPRRRLLPIVTGLLAVVAVVFAVLLWIRPSSAGVDLNAYKYTPFSFEPGGQVAARWSPDGRAVAFSAGATSWRPYQVFVRYLDAPVATQLTHDPSPAIVIGWMPDGKRIVYRRGATLWSVATVGGEPEPMPLPEGGASSRMALSPDGTSLATVRTAEDGTNSVWTSSPVGAPFTRYQPDPFAVKEMFNTPILNFSPDGRQLLLSWTTAKGNELWRLPYPANTANPPRQVLTNLSSYTGTTDVTWMPDNRRVVIPMRLTPGTATQLWLADTESGDRRAITGGTHDSYRGVVSPDGRRMIVSEVAGSSVVVQVDLRTAVAKLLIADGRNSMMPAWAADVPQLAYVSDRNGEPAIWLRGAGPADRPIVTATDFPPDTTWSFMAPALSPDADRVIYLRVEQAAGGGGGGARLWISSTSGGAPVPLIKEEVLFMSPGWWSPDGNWFAYSGLVNGKSALMKVKTSGQATPELLKEGTIGGSPVWSPKGTWILYATANGDDHIVSPDGKTDRRLGNWPTRAWTFSADEKLLYGLRDDGDRELLFSVDVASGAEKVIGDIGREFSPSSPLNPGIRFSLAPDGRSFVYPVDQTMTNLWLMEGFAGKR